MVDEADAVDVDGGEISIHEQKLSVKIQVEGVDHLLEKVLVVAAVELVYLAVQRNFSVTT